MLKPENTLSAGLELPPRLILAGGSGFIGQALARHFAAAGLRPVLLTRAPRSASLFEEIQWDASSLGDWAGSIEGASAVINLTGRSVDCRYTAAHRRAIMLSRTESTRVIGAAIRRCSQPPKVWLNMSTATIYRHTLGPAWDEQGEIGASAEAHDAFSIEVAEAWEEALRMAATPGTRKVALRAAMVLGHAPNSVFPVLGGWSGAGWAGAWPRVGSSSPGFMRPISAGPWTGSSSTRTSPVRSTWPRRNL